MREYKKEIVTKDVLDKLICSRCGKEDEGVMHSDITSFNVFVRYGSRYDGDIYSADLCDNCLEEVILPIATLTKTEQYIKDM